MTDVPGSTRTRNPGRTLTIIGAVCAVVALIFLPPVFGIAGAVLGFVAYSKGDKPVGMYVGIASIVTGILGMVIGAAVLSSMR